MLAHCGSQLIPIVIAVLHAGFRVSELLSLTWEDIDFRRGMMTVKAAYAKNEGSRSVPITMY